MRRQRPSWPIAVMKIICVHLCLSAIPTLAAEPKPFLLHLPGIGGHMRIDDLVTSGLTMGGVIAEIQIYDWTNGDPGLPALGGYDRNLLQAQKIADMITARYRDDPKRRIILTCHSGGSGLAVWALERLPEDVKVDVLLMLAPALSPQYDLSKALRHVNRKAYAFTSTLDWINGIGTRNAGTIDRVKTDAAGNVGFQVPPNADLAQYAKLVAVPYDSAWTRYGNSGDHIGAMERFFARMVLAPLLLTGELPRPVPATRPTTANN